MKDIRGMNDDVTVAPTMIASACCWLIVLATVQLDVATVAVSAYAAKVLPRRGTNFAGRRALKTRGVVHRYCYCYRYRYRCPCTDRPNRFSWSLQSSNNNNVNNSNNAYNAYNLAKPVWDLYAFRSVRGDALTKYNTANQSEPLRINILLTLTLILLSLPWLLPELMTSSTSAPSMTAVTSTLPSSTLPLPALVWPVSLVSASVSAYLTYAQCQARNRQLRRFEKECVVLDLAVQLPNSIFADAPFDSTPVTIRSMLVNSPFRRVVIVAGSSMPQLRETMAQLSVLGRRLVQAQTCVVVLPMDQSRLQRNAPLWREPYEETASKSSDDLYTSNVRFPWLAQAADPTAWLSFLDTLSDESNVSFAWLGMSSSGRSFGSGNSPPSWLQVLGRHLSPFDLVEEATNEYSVVVGPPPKASTTGQLELLASQKRFYEALTTGNRTEMDAVFDAATGATANVVSNVMEQGGRLDSWQTCLADGARPAGLKITDCDVCQPSAHLAYTTCLEIADVGGARGPTLLAMQQWTKSTNGSWTLALHQTIPWTPDAPAAGILMCDGRGCVSLVRQ